jgi:hypothetical protein
MSEVILSNIQIWRMKSRDGTMTLEDSRAAIAAIRKERVGASEVSAKSGVKKAATAAKKVPVNSDDLLLELGDL